MHRPETFSITKSYQIREQLCLEIIFLFSSNLNITKWYLKSFWKPSLGVITVNPWHRIRHRQRKNQPSFPANVHRVSHVHANTFFVMDPTMIQKNLLLARNRVHRRVKKLVTGQITLTDPGYKAIWKKIRKEQSKIIDLTNILESITSDDVVFPQRCENCVGGSTLFFECPVCINFKEFYNHLPSKYISDQFFDINEVIEIKISRFSFKIAEEEF